ncbi:hypothetical protein ACFV0R_21190 [Streptomyces sp. NPDC059578]
MTTRSDRSAEGSSHRTTVTYVSPREPYCRTMVNTAPDRGGTLRS